MVLATTSASVNAGEANGSVTASALLGGAAGLDGAAEFGCAGWGAGCLASCCIAFVCAAFVRSADEAEGEAFAVGGLSEGDWPIPVVPCVACVAVALLAVALVAGSAWAA